VARVIAVDPSKAMVAAMSAQGVETVRTGFLSYEHQGDPPAAVFTRNALHHDTGPAPIPMMEAGSWC